MKNFISQPRIKILVVIAIALIISTGFSNTIFIAKTPLINKVFIAKVINFPSTFISNTNNFVASLLRPKNSNTAPVFSNAQTTTVNRFKELPLASLKLVAKGIYAQEDKVNNITYVRLTDGIEYEQKTFKINGKDVNVYVGKGLIK